MFSWNWFTVSRNAQHGQRVNDSISRERLLVMRDVTYRMPKPERPTPDSEELSFPLFVKDFSTVQIQISAD
jgi:hypothetical protein